jgi:uncharacterized repeat protein (TIGR03803 family)
LVRATDGNFYGTTSGGGSSGDGTVFEITSGGTLTTLHSFQSTDGAEPEGGLLQATSGALYGTTFEGGAPEDGTVFALGVGLAPFVETVPTTGKVGQRVLILGTNLKGSTKVMFQGRPAMFAVASNTLIKAFVPPGATTGTVTVTTPSGTLAGNLPFQVE